MAPVGSPCVAGPLAVHATARRSCTHGPATPHVWARTAVVVATVLVAVALLQPIYAQTRTAAIPSPQAPANQQPQQALQDGRFVPDESLARLPPGQKRAVPPAHTWHRSNILLFGDSLTELGTSPASGWSNALADRYKRRADVINRGFGGYTSKQGLEILPEILETIDLGRTLLAVVWFGTNDAATPDGPQGFMYVPPETYADNIRKIAADLKAAGAANVMFVTPPPVDDAKRSKSRPEYPDSPPDRKFELAKNFSATAVAAGAAAGIPVLNMFEKIQGLLPGKAWSDAFMLDDGLHFNPKGQEAAFKLLNDFIWSEFKSIRPEQLPYHHLAYDSIQYKRSAEQFADEEAAGDNTLERSL